MAKSLLIWLVNHCGFVNKRVYYFTVWINCIHCCKIHCFQKIARWLLDDLALALVSLCVSVCPKWAKVQKNHAIKKSVVLLIICSSALRTIELIKWVTEDCIQSRSEVWNTMKMYLYTRKILTSTDISPLVRQLTAFKGEGKVLKLFAKHIKVSNATAFC